MTLREKSRRWAVGLTCLLALTACAAEAETRVGERAATSKASTRAAVRATSPEATATTAPTTKPAIGTYPPSWLGTRLLPIMPNGYGQVRPTPKALRNRRFTLPDLVPMLPGRGFVARVHNPARRVDLAKSSWRPGCPVRRDQLAAIRMTFWGFDDRRHTGELMVNAAVADDIVRVFRTLYRARFPMERMVIVGPWKPGGPTTGDGNGTGAFVCRPSTGASYFSQHAYGLAIDLNTFQNPYHKGDLVLPELASAYLDRGWRRRAWCIPRTWSCAPSARSAGSGAGIGAPRRTTSTSARTVADLREVEWAGPRDKARERTQLACRCV